MKSLISAVLLAPTLAFAQVDRPVLCGSVRAVFEVLTSTYKEEPQWIGSDSERGKYALFVNPQTNQFTIVQFNDEIACVLGVGNTSFFIPPKATL